MKPAPASESRLLTFHWPQRPQISLALVGFLLLSVLAHGLAFYIFQVVYPPVVAISPPPVQVNLLTPSTPENQSLLQWIDSEDPAAIANPHEIVPGNLYDIAYQRSFEEIHTAPKSPDEVAPAIPFPPAQNAMEIIGSALKSVPQTAASIPPHPTELKFSGPLAGRKILSRPPLKFNTANPDSREPASFLVGVGPNGKVRYTFFMGVETDDNAGAVDRQAEEYLNGVEFSRAPGAVAWGVATYYWGNDAGRSNPPIP